MLVIRRLQHHPGPARWSMEHIGSCNPGAVAFYWWVIISVKILPPDESYRLK